MSDPKDKLNIKLHVYDIDMSVRINRDDEQLYRKMAQLITEVMGNYMSRYKGLKSDKEVHYMALVDIALRYGMEQRRNDVTPLLEELSKFDEEIQRALGD